MSNPAAVVPVHALQRAWDALTTLGWLAERTPEVRQLLRTIARARTFEAGETLYRMDDVPNGVFGLVDGALDISIPRSDGEDVVMHRAQPGFWIGDLALFARQRRLVSVRAAARCHVVHLPQDRLARLVAAHPALATDFYELSHQNMATALALLGNLAVTGAENRVAQRLLMQEQQLPAGDPWIRLSQEALAELVALSLPSVRRAVRGLESAGLIESGYRRIRVANREGLARLCGLGLPPPDGG